MNSKAIKFDNNTVKGVLNDIQSYCYFYGCGCGYGDGWYHPNKDCSFCDLKDGCMFQKYKYPANWDLDTCGKNINEYNDKTLEVLQYIKSYCKKREEKGKCNEECKFWGIHQENCGFYCCIEKSYSPEEWEINDIPPSKIFYR